MPTTRWARSGKRTTSGSSSCSPSSGPPTRARSARSPRPSRSRSSSPRSGSSSAPLRRFRRWVECWGLFALVAPIVAGSATLALVWWKRYEASRYTAALAVAAIIAGWALAQSPVFLEGLTVREGAAGRDTLVAVTVAVLAGAAILFPSLALLFRLVLGGDLGRGESVAERPAQPRPLLTALAPGLLPRLAIACLVAGIGFTTIP